MLSVKGLTHYTQALDYNTNISDSSWCIWGFLVTFAGSFCRGAFGIEIVGVHVLNSLQMFFGLFFFLFSDCLIFSIRLAFTHVIKSLFI